MRYDNEELNEELKALGFIIRRTVRKNKRNAGTLVCRKKFKSSFLPDPEAYALKCFTLKQLRQNSILTIIYASITVQGNRLLLKM